ncbi:YfiR family protein [Geomesophilobacter sediminis]|uniref:YfiR family protein n=1 Tax=Geomesophilobacter sediminis TaxID=2798584 RepID=A0A8J7JMF3_9BACT|nr:YfiR family protein [Geomesophilobacter sediminis]MBJ6725780.1 YfiR family protein [Geomesophilobacter sediminis]
MVLACLFSLAVSVPAAPAKLTEGQVKSAYLLNFAQYAEWPHASFPDAGTPLVISVLGKSSYLSAFDALTDRTVHKRRAQVRFISRIEELGDSHILFICASEKGQLSRILNSLKSEAVLTVSDIKDFTDAGGMIGLVPKDGRLAFEINMKAARRADIKLSSHLLRLAVAIRE